MPNKSKDEGVTPSERYLSKLCRRSFLSLWSYTNLYTDRGGHELCDLLVVFGDNVIIFSDKHVQFDRSIDTLIAWRRWFKKAVRKSADQLFFAERWLRKFQSRIYLDSQCKESFPIALPTPDRIRVHRVAVARGVYEACRDYFGGNSLGSLIVESDFVDDAHYDMPFRIGNVNPDKGFVHVFEDFTLDAVLRELDTVSDFITYLSKREQFLTREKPTVIAAGDEQLLAIYLTKINAEGEHDFVLPGEGIPDAVHFDESFWDSMVQNPQYVAKKRADAISYTWDRLIEHFIEYARGYEGQTLSELERALRLMASEMRIDRRGLASALVNLLKGTPKGMRAARLAYSKDRPERAYLFLILPPLNGEEYQRYREYRQGLLLAYCKVAKLKCPEASYIIGIATDRGIDGTSGSSEDLLALDVRDWTSDKQEEAERLREEFSLLLESNITKTERRDSEWPNVKDVSVAKSHNSGLNRKQRRELERKRRRRKKK